MAAVRLTSTSDFITPALACVKPVQIDRAKANRVLRLEGMDEDDSAAAATSSARPATAKVTLNDCLACAGCITSAETVLVTQQSIGQFERMLSAPGTYDLVVVSLSAAARAAISVHCGVGLQETHARLSGFLKGLGCHRVLDCGVATDVGLMQTAAEFVHRFRASPAAAAAAAAAAPPAASPTPLTPAATPSEGSITSAGALVETALPLPLLSSSCPGWVCYAEKTSASVLPHLSRVKSPQQITGTLLKYGYAAACGISAERVCHVSVMPCFDKKLEAARDDFFNPAAGDSGCRDVDCVLSSGELLEMLEARGCPR